MNAIQKHLEDQKFDRLNKETAVFKLSRLIQEAIGLEEVPEELDFFMRNYRIVATQRKFAVGWVRLLEVMPIKVQHPLESKCTQRWVIEQNGTRTINLPPVIEVIDFLEELKEYTKEI